MDFKKVFLITLLLLFILTIGAVSASENFDDTLAVSDTSDNMFIDASGGVSEIGALSDDSDMLAVNEMEEQSIDDVPPDELDDNTDALGSSSSSLIADGENGANLVIENDNYDTYFDENGKIKEDSGIHEGDEIFFGELNNKEFVIDIPLTITGSEGNTLTDSSITIGDGVNEVGSVVVKDLVFQNTNKNAIAINQYSKDITIENNLLNLTFDDGYTSMAIVAYGFVDEISINSNTILVNSIIGSNYAIDTSSYLHNWTKCEKNANHFIITNNMINIDSSCDNGCSVGIYLDSVVNSLIEGNTIAIHTEGDSSNYGIQLVDTFYSNFGEGGISPYNITINDNNINLESNDMTYGITVISLNPYNADFEEYVKDMVISSNDLTINSAKGAIGIGAASSDVLITNNALSISADSEEINNAYIDSFFGNESAAIFVRNFDNNWGYCNNTTVSYNSGISNVQPIRVSDEEDERAMPLVIDNNHIIVAEFDVSVNEDTIISFDDAVIVFNTMPNINDAYIVKVDGKWNLYNELNELIDNFWDDDEEKIIIPYSALNLDNFGDYEISLIVSDLNSYNSVIISGTIHVEIQEVTSEDSFSCHVATHGSKNYYWGNVCEVWFDGELVQSGMITLKIKSPMGEYVSLNKYIDGPDSIRFELDELNFVDDVYGAYEINVTYSNEDNVLVLVENATFFLTQFDYYVCDDDLYIGYPFDVIRFYGEYDEDEDESTYINVYVNDGVNPYESSGENPYRWTLEDLGITESGEYNITIKGYKGDHFIEEFNYTLNVFDEISNIVFYSNELGVLEEELNNPVLYLVCPDDIVGEQFRLNINWEDYNDYTFESSMNWTLEDLGIDHSGDYEFRIFNENDDELAYAGITVRGIIAEDSFNCWVSTHESKENDWSNICDVWVDENAVQDGTITLSIESPSGEINTDSKEIGDPEGTRWELGELLDLGLIDDYGTYTINVTYSNGDKEFSLAENRVFTLTHFNYNVCEGEIYYAYPFDVIRFYSNYDEEEDTSTYIKIYVNGEEAGEPSGESPFRWTLDDLGTTAAGDYTITIEGYNGDDLIEAFSYSIIVYDELDNARLFSNELGVESWELNDPVLILACPNDWIGQSFRLHIKDEDEFENELEVEITSASMSWTLEDLGIDHNQGYDIRLYNDEDEDIASAWLNVNGIISEDSLHPWVSSHEPISADWDPWIVNVHFDDNVGEGSFNLEIIKDDGTTFTDTKTVDDADENHDVIWSLEELRDILNETGTYTINLNYTNGDKEFSLIEDAVFTLTQLNYNVYEGDIYIDYPYDVIRFYGQEDDEGDSPYIKVYVNDRENPYEFSGEYPLRCTLEDLGITEPGDYGIIIKAYKGDNFIEDFSYGIYVFDEFENIALISNQLSVESWNLDDPVLYLICPDNMIGTHVVIKINDEDFDEFDIESTSMSWTLEDLGIDSDGEYCIRLSDDNDEMITDTWINVYCIDETKMDVWNWDNDEDGVLYLDYEGNVIKIHIPRAKSGKLVVSVNDTVLYTPIIYPDNDYAWDLETLYISAVGEYDIFVKLINEDGTEEVLIDETLNVVEFNNDTVRLKKIRNYDDDGEFYKLYCPENAELTFIVNIYEQHWNSEEGDYDNVFVETIEIPVNSSFYNKWTDLSDAESNFDLDSNHFAEIVCVKLNGEEIVPEESKMKDNGVGFGIDEGRYYDGGIFGTVSFPFNREFGDANITISSGDFIFFKKISEMEYSWENGLYLFYLDMDDVDSFDHLSDKDVITSVFTHDNGKMIRWHCIEKNDEYIHLYDLQSHKGTFGTVCAYGLEIIMEIATSSEDEEEEEGDGEDTNNYFAVITIPDSFNVTDGEISVISGDKIILSRNLSDLERIYQYWIAGYEYFILMDELDLDNLNDKDIVNVTLSSDGEVLQQDTFVYRCGDEGYCFHHYSDRVEFSVHYGELSDPEFDWGIRDGIFIDIAIPDMANVTDGRILITLDDGTVILNKSLSSFKDSGYPYIAEYDDEFLKWDYNILANETVYDNFPENQNLTFTLYYGNNIITHKGIREGNSLNRIVAPDDILINLFDIVISEDVLVNGNDFAITIDCIGANRQSIYYDVGGGYFSVYVNGVKVENLGRINQYDGETELELTRLCSLGDGVIHLDIYLADLGITENGVYDIKVTHNTESDYNLIPTESEILNQKVTLTSNVKANYTNESVEWLTGYGVDPVLMYLDTYYGDINETTGTITVYNEDNEEILTKNIKDLTYEDGRYSLRYSDFTDKNFGDKITVKYSDGNERNGETELDVKWRDVTPEDFNMTVLDDVDNYYGNFVNLTIPDLINTGEIIVTIKFKNNHNASISNMNVSTDFDSQAVYRFNIADIKTHYENGNFALSLSDLGFYETDGDYEVDVNFTGDGSTFLPVSSRTFDVALIDDILINISDSSRYGIVLPFGSVQIFEPMNAYAELYVDGVLYAHKTFEKGFISFDSNVAWTPGVHTAEVKVFDAEFGSLLNSSSKEFEVLVNSAGVDAGINGEFTDESNVFITFVAPKEGTAFTKIDDGTEKVFNIVQGENRLNLGLLGIGNHSIWVLYNETLDDGSLAFYNNYLNVSIGGWMMLPNPLVLNDEDTIRFNLGEDATGTISIIIDNGLLNKTIPLVNGCAEIRIDESLFDNDPEHKYGLHTYEIIYSGDETHEEMSRSGNFTVAYILKDNIIKEGYPYRQYYIIIITVPSDAKGDVTIVVDGQTYTAPAVNGQAEFKVTGLDELGQYPVNVSYSGDEKYPESGYVNSLNVEYYGVVGDIVDGKRIVSLRLPTNANGNLVIYNDNRGTKLYSKALENGYAEIDLSDLTVGVYELRAVYEGDDYDVRPYSDTFKVMPYVYITQNAVMDDNVTIYLDLDNSTGYILIVMDGLSPVLQEIKNGKVNYTLSTVGYSYGDHNVTFQYFGNSFDGDLFYEIDPQTGKYVPVKYDLHILAQEVEMNESLADGNVLKVYFPKDAKGKVKLFLNGTEYAVAEIINGVATFYLGNVKGTYYCKVQYYGDSKYAPSTQGFSITIRPPRIAASALSIVYTAKKKYSVTVYKTNGKVASGVKVTFLINNKAYKTVKTNKKGVASVAISKVPGSYKITSKALGVSATKKLTVKHLVSLKKVKVKRSAKKLVLTATLKKVNGKYLKNKKVTFKFNGKKYKVKTNKKGVAKLVIKAKVLKKLKVGKKVKYQATYLKDTVKKTVKVKK